MDGDSKYVDEIPNDNIFWKFSEILYLSSAHACRMVSAN